MRYLELYVINNFDLALMSFGLEKKKKKRLKVRDEELRYDARVK